MSEGLQLPDALLAVVEKTLNAWLTRDPEGAAAFAPLAGRLIAVEIAGFGTRVTLIPGLNDIQVFGDYDAAPECLIRGTPLGLLRLSLAERKDGLLRSGEVEIEGDTALAQAFSAALAGLRVDWEEQLARVLGDPLAHQVGRRARATGQWGQRASGSLADSLGDYLREESRLVPTRHEIDDFLLQVDRARDDEERLAARIERLARHLPSSHPASGAAR